MGKNSILLKICFNVIFILFLLNYKQSINYFIFSQYLELSVNMVNVARNAYGHNQHHYTWLGVQIVFQTEDVVHFYEIYLRRIYHRPNL